MKLSELLHHLEILDGMKPQGGRDLLAKEYDPVVHYMENHPLAQPDQIETLRKALATLNRGIKDFDAALADVDSWIRKESEQYHRELLAQSYVTYEDMTQKPQSYLYQADAVLGNRAPASEDTKEFVYSRLMAYNTWRDAALIIRPGLEDWISQMVAFDPLYVFDHYQELLTPAQERFNDRYNNRVRWCVGPDATTDSILHAVPDNQIGFCFAWYFFYWKPFELIRRYLQEIYTKLRPGGILAFTFCDGDRWAGALNAEKGCGCFVPRSMLQSFGESLGFVTVTIRDLDSATTWIEFQKPGNRVSIKGGQAAAQIIPKSKKVVDVSTTKLYTQEEIDFIQQEAANLNIDIHGRSIEKLQELVQKRKGTNQ